VLGVDTLGQELATITAEALKAADDDEYDDIMGSAPNFGLFFGQLRRLVCDNVPPEELNTPTAQLTLATTGPPVSNTVETISTPSTSFISKPKKRPNSLTVSTSSPKKVRSTPAITQNIPRTPDQPTVPKNPAHSGDSIESAEEDNTKQMIRTFIHTTLSHLGRDFRRISWPLYAQKCRLDISGSF
jgi:hypothetical protein